MNFSDTLTFLRKREGLSQQELGERIGVAKSTVSMYERDERKPSYEMLEAIADYFNVDMDFLTGKSDVERRYTFPPTIPPGFQPMPSFRMVPRIGRIACGEPITAEQNIEDYDPVPDFIKADFTLACKGDSMINARIFDGDIVCISQSSEVHSGDIAAVLVDSEDATLKRVRLFADHIILEPENPMYKPMSFWNEDMNKVRIIGKATHFISAVR